MEVEVWARKKLWRENVVNRFKNQVYEIKFVYYLDQLRENRFQSIKSHGRGKYEKKIKYDLYFRMRVFFNVTAKTWFSRCANLSLFHC